MHGQFRIDRSWGRGRPRGRGGVQNKSADLRSKFPGTFFWVLLPSKIKKHRRCLFFFCAAWPVASACGFLGSGFRKGGLKHNLYFGSVKSSQVATPQFSEIRQRISITSRGRRWCSWKWDYFKWPIDMGSIFLDALRLGNGIQARCKVKSEACSSRRQKSHMQRQWADWRTGADARVWSPLPPSPSKGSGER